MIASDFVPKEKLSAYQRWEMDSFEAADMPQEAGEIDADSGVQPEDELQAPLPAEEVAAVFQNAKDEGYAAGVQEGHAAGYAEGRKIAEAEVKTEVAHIQALLHKLEQDFHDMDQHVADDLLELALALAKKIVTEALKLQPELIIPIVQEAIRNLPNTVQNPRLFLHPEDAKLVLAHLSGQLEQDHWSIREDEQLSRGGCRIEANGSEVNGSLEVRWQRVLSAIGQQDAWLDRKN